MTVPEVFTALDRAIAEASAADRPGLVVLLAARLAALGAGLSVPASSSSAPTVTAGPLPQFLITPQEAATIARVPLARLYAWAHGQRWATRPTRRCLRIDEVGFRRWLAARSA